MGMELFQLAVGGLPIRLTFERPWALASLLLVVPVVWLALVSRVASSRFRTVLATSLRAAAVAAMALALAGVQAARQTDLLCVTVLVDESRSVQSASRRTALEQLSFALQDMKGAHRLSVISFGGDAALQRLFSPDPVLPARQGDVRPDFTDIGEALRLALAVAAPNAANRLLLISDGNDTVPDPTALTAALAARNANVPIDVVPLASAGEGDLRVEGLIAPGQVRVDEPLALRAVIRSDSAQDVRITLKKRGRLARLGGQAGPYYREVRLNPGVNVIEVARDRLDSGGFYDYQVAVEPASGDALRSNNLGGAVVRAIGDREVLIVDGSGEVGMVEGPQGRLLLDALTREGIAARLTGPAGFPASMVEMNYNGCIVLSDVPADALSDEQMALAERWVRAGGGLVWIGGVNSFGPGGYAGTGIERLAPVRCDVKRRIERASLALAIAIDQSGSMGAPVTGAMTKMDLANNAAAEAVKLLDHRDVAGVVMVDTEYKWITAPALRAMIGRFQQELVAGVLANKPGGGGIYCLTALRACMEALSRESAASRHILLFADTDDAEQQQGCLELADDAVRQGVTISTVGLGLPRPGNHGEFLQELARRGGGQSYFTDDPRTLPRVFVRDVSIVARNAFIEPEDGITPALALGPQGQALHPILRGVSGVPKLKGQTAVTLKDRADLLMHGPEADDALLAAWRLGLGRSVAWASDAQGRWAGEWVNWEGFTPFWAQVVRWAMRPSELDSPVTTWVTLRGERGVILAEAMDERGQPLSGLAPKAVVESTDPSAPPQIVPLRQEAPGQYRGEFRAETVGAYIVTVADGEGNPLDAAGAVMDYAPEFLDLRTDVGALAEIAAASGGRLMEAPADLFVPPAEPTYVSRPITAPLLAAGLLLFFCDIVARRFVLPERLVRWLSPGERRQVTTASLGRLKQVRIAGQAAVRRTSPPPAAPSGTGGLAQVPETSPTDRDKIPPAGKGGEGPPEQTGPDQDATLSDRLRAAKRRARDEMVDKGRRG